VTEVGVNPATVYVILNPFGVLPAVLAYKNVAPVIGAVPTIVEKLIVVFTTELVKPP